MEKSHEQKTVEAYSHNYRDMALSQESLYDMLTGFADMFNVSKPTICNIIKNKTWNYV